MSTSILGIRHHGPGSARHVRDFLERTRPDIVLVEGPPDAEGILQWMVHEEMKPPVAILVYQPDDLSRSLFYPFAEFSPEWQAILYAKRNNIHVRFMDLPAAHSFALKQAEENAAKAAANETTDLSKQIVAETDNDLLPPSLNSDATGVGGTDQIGIHADPIGHLAEAAGYTDGEKWWETVFEHRTSGHEVFDAVAEAMQSLRDTLPSRNDREEMLREAWMRKTIRQAEKEMFQNIAVICGAWHVPALQQMPRQKEDNELLKGLPKVKVDSTWIPWSYSRLSYYSGYGAGIASPGWYDHIWNHPADDGTRWMAGVAKLFRKAHVDTSVAHVIDAVRLAESLASLRSLPRAGLEELNEATLTVLCGGESIMMELIHNELIVSNRIGQVPSDIPKPPLQADIEKTQKRLRLQPTADFKDHVLDLRNDNDLERSIFLHRLQLLEINWGERSRTSGKGTFKEQWRLQWEPSLSIDIIEKGNWGNTVEKATSEYTAKKARDASSLKQVSGLLELAIPAELPQAVDIIIECINNLAASSGDVMQLMDALPGLVNVSRYGNVRKTNAATVFGIAKSIITRICVSLPATCVSVNEDAAQTLTEMTAGMNDAISLLQDNDCTAEWCQALAAIIHNDLTSPVIAGFATRILFDRKLLQGNDLIEKFGFAMSPGNPHATVAAWLEGFLKGSGMILLLEDELWQVIDNWIDSLEEDAFHTSLPVLRRTFANFSQPERKKMGEKAKSGAGSTVNTRPFNETETIDHERAHRALPVIMQLLNIKPGT